MNEASVKGVWEAQSHELSIWDWTTALEKSEAICPGRAVTLDPN